MFTELTDELLDLRADVRGFGGAPFAASEDACSCSSNGCTTIVLCCHLCW
jgi:hypothetical protein